MQLTTRAKTSVERSWAWAVPIESSPATFPYVEGYTGSVCFLVSLNGTLVTCFASSLWLHRRYGWECMRGGLVAAYKANADDIDAEVVRRVNAGAETPVRLRAADC